MYLPRVIPGLACVLLTVSMPAMADDHPMLDNASITVGMFANNFSGSIRADGNTKNSGTRLDFSRDLGEGGTQWLPYIAASWRPWDRHEFELSYYHFEVSHDKTLDRDLVFNNQTLEVGTDLHSKTTVDAINLTYRYWAWIGDQAAFGVTGGLQNYSFDLKLSGTAFASGPNGTNSGSRSATAKASTDLPNPSIGVAYRWQMAPWARLVVDAGAFKANIGNVDATLYNARLGAEFYPFGNWAIVPQFMFNRINADVTGSRFNGNATFRFRGGQLLVKYRF
ncbi:hypothetical protein DVT68_18930 [Dyella solisilvae]|uniref:Uncharacterized protein n=1 Tax=Dyella solisilvae TaxID=1920168 RepID=A0A370K2S1_9GAMM|nr:hypothetical protein [Dyella solisilvae]RDI96965.1 hypothetical protein DVT68_18930 [Dyella solisilvae]